MDPLNDTLSVGPSGCLTIEGIRVGSKGIVATKPAEDGGAGAPTEEKASNGCLSTVQQCLHLEADHLSAPLPRFKCRV